MKKTNIYRVVWCFHLAVVLAACFPNDAMADWLLLLSVVSRFGRRVRIKIMETLGVSAAIFMAARERRDTPNIPIAT